MLIDVLVTDGRRAVTGLTAADFELHDNTVPQSIEQLYMEQLPLTIIMVLDTSGSVAGERLEALKKGAAVVVDRLRPGDQAAIVTFAARSEPHGGDDWRPLAAAPDDRRVEG